MGMLREFLSQHALCCATTSKLVDQLIVEWVSVMFLGSNCFIQPLLSSECSIYHCFDDMLEQQGVALKKLHMHINPNNFN